MVIALARIVITRAIVAVWSVFVWDHGDPPTTEVVTHARLLQDMLEPAGLGA